MNCQVVLLLLLYQFFVAEMEDILFTVLKGITWEVLSMAGFIRKVEDHCCSVRVCGLGLLDICGLSAGTNRI
jgi:hypothetical protein